MHASPARRAMVIGLDGASMEIIRHMVERGHAPNLGKLIETGGQREMLGVLPTLTPPGWTSMMTGCWPGSHEVTDFDIRALGHPLDETVWGINTALCKREYLWTVPTGRGSSPTRPDGPAAGCTRLGCLAPRRGESPGCSDD